MALVSDAIISKLQQLLSSEATIDDALVCRQTLPAYLVNFCFIIVFMVYTSIQNRLVLANIAMHHSCSHINK